MTHMHGHDSKLAVFSTRLQLIVLLKKDAVPHLTYRGQICISLTPDELKDAFMNAQVSISLCNRTRESFLQKRI